MEQGAADDLAAELFDEDLPNAATATFGQSDPFVGSLSREYVETDDVVGVRSVFLCPTAALEGLRQGQQITIDGEAWFARVIESRGRAISAVVLGK